MALRSCVFVHRFSFVCPPPVEGVAIVGEDISASPELLDDDSANPSPTHVGLDTRKSELEGGADHDNNTSAHGRSELRDVVSPATNDDHDDLQLAA